MPKPLHTLAVVRRDGGPNGNLLSLYTGDGTRSEDWNSWREPLLAPFDGVVVGFQINPETTSPGVRGSGRSSTILFQQLIDGEPTDVHVAYVHVRAVTVSQGDTVRAGEPVARIGNNGLSFHPHVHVGAFRGEMMSEDAVPLRGADGSCSDGAGEGYQPADGGWSWQTASIVRHGTSSTRSSTGIACGGAWIATLRFVALSQSQS